MEGVEAVDARVTGQGLRAVRLVAAWVDQDGQPMQRALVLLGDGVRR